LRLKYITKHTTPRKCYIYSKANWNTINKDLNTLNEIVEEKQKNGADVHQLWDIFKKHLFGIMNNNIPKKEIKSRNNIPWVKRKERKMLKKKQRLCKARKTNKWTNYRTFQKECKRHLRKVEWDYVNTNIIDGLNNNNTKPVWKYAKSKHQESGGIAPLKKGTNLISDSKGKAELLLNQFKSVFTKPTNNDLPSTSWIQSKNNIRPIIIDQKGLEKLLTNINPSKASGPDNIPNRILKECAIHLAPILKTILQCSLDTGELPKDWRDANISSIFQKGDKHLPENYRPVSLTSVTCKILEHIICRHLLKHLEKNRILTNLNHGFRSGYSCETQLITTINDFLQEHDK
jgi:hypothetical protein